MQGSTTDVLVAVIKPTSEFLFLGLIERPMTAVIAKAHGMRATLHIASHISCLELAQKVPVSAPVFSTIMKYVKLLFKHLFLCFVIKYGQCIKLTACFTLMSIFCVRNLSALQFRRNVDENRRSCAKCGKHADIVTQYAYRHKSKPCQIAQKQWKCS